MAHIEIPVPHWHMDDDDVMFRGVCGGIQVTRHTSVVIQVSWRDISDEAYKCTSDEAYKCTSDEAYKCRGV